MPLWQATEAELDRIMLPPPFWAFAWAGGQALARYVLDHPDIVAGRRVLDFASGSGLVAIAAAKAGATVTAAEIDGFAAAAIGLNAEANGVEIAIETADLLDDPATGAFDVVLVGDVFYERALAARALAFLDRQAAARRRRADRRPGPLLSAAGPPDAPRQLRRAGGARCRGSRHQADGGLCARDLRSRRPAQTQRSAACRRRTFGG